MSVFSECVRDLHGEGLCGGYGSCRICEDATDEAVRILDAVSKWAHDDHHDAGEAFYGCRECQEVLRARVARDGGTDTERELAAALHLI